MAPSDSLARLRKSLIGRAEGGRATVIKLCREAGISRSRFYELRARYRSYGEAGLRPKPRPAARSTRRLAAPLVDAIVAYAVEHPTHGERSIADALARPRFGSWRVSHSGVRNVLRRAGLAPGAPGRSRDATGRQLRRVTTDNGPEFGRVFSDTCRRPGHEHHRIPPRSPNLNAFVERFQGTVLHLHYRVAFRYRYYTSVADIDADLAAWLRHYNFERPHRGYRTRGRTPASLFYAERPAILIEMGA